MSFVPLLSLWGQIATYTRQKHIRLACGTVHANCSGGKIICLASVKLEVKLILHFNSPPPNTAKRTLHNANKPANSIRAAKSFQTPRKKSAFANTFSPPYPTPLGNTSCGFSVFLFSSLPFLCAFIRKAPVHKKVQEKELVARGC